MHLKNSIPQRTSLVEQTATIIREHISNGLWQEVMPGEFELCEKFKISRVTLRAALDELKNEGWFEGSRGQRRQITRHRVRKKLRRPASSVVLLTPVSLEEMPAGLVIRLLALREHLSAVGYGLVIQCNEMCYSRHPERVLATLAERLRPAGWLLYLSTSPMQKWFFEQRYNCVISGSCHPNIELPSIDIDYAATCRHAVGKFVAKGRKRIALIMPFSDQAGNMESERGFMEAGAQLNHHGVETLIIHHAGTVEAVCRAVDELVSGPKRMTGLLVAKPSHTITTLCHLLRIGIRVPADIAVISRDDDPSLEPMVPAISRYHISPALFARKISRIVVNMLRGGVRTRRAYRMLPELLPGETLG